MDRIYEVIGVCSGWGAQVRGCEDGPEAIYKKMALKTAYHSQEYLWSMLCPLFQNKHKKLDKEQVLDLIIQLNGHLRDCVKDTLARAHFPIVIGGDHSIAVGTWSGVKDAMGPGKKLGMIWVDAHMDSHIPSTSPSGAWHGMPLAALLGCGVPEFCMRAAKDPVLLPQHTCLVGVRSYESGEKELLERMKVRIFYMDEVMKRGLSEVMKEALAIAGGAKDGFGVSLDLDVIDPKEAPGVGSPENGGVFIADLFRSLSDVFLDNKLKAFELVEYNPQRDRDERTACIALEMLGRILLS